MLTLWDLLLVWEIKSVNTRVLHSACSVFVNNLIDSDHALCGNTSLSKVNLLQSVLESERF